MKFVSSKMSITTAVLASLFVLLESDCGWAQLDSSYELLLGSAPTRTPLSPEAAATPKPVKKTVHKKARAVASEEASKTNVEVPKAEPSKALPPVLSKAPEIQQEPTIGQQAKSLFGPNPGKIIDYYHGQFEDSDSRLNKLEINFAPTLVNNESSSNYSYLSYRSVFSGVNVGGNVWLTPAIGLGGNFLFSLGADTSGDAVTGTRTPVRYEMLDTALKFRTFFGFQPVSKSVEFDILYSDFKLTAPSDDLYRVGLRSSGLGLKMSLRLPTSSDFAWVFGGSFWPRLQHSETAGTLTLTSGTNTDNTRMGLHLGSEIKMSRQAQIFTEVSALTETNNFTGDASLPDPATKTIPKNISVANTFYLFSLGYRWGN